MANDLRYSGNLLVKDKIHSGFILKLIARFIEVYFNKLDHFYNSNTIGHFIRVSKL